MNTVLPASLAPTGTIRRLGTFPKCTGRRLWQTGQIRIVVSSPHSGQDAGPGRLSPGRPSPGKGGGRAPVKPVRARSTGSASGAQRRPDRLIRPAHRNQICRAEISS